MKSKTFQHIRLLMKMHNIKSADLAVRFGVRATELSTILNKADGVADKASEYFSKLEEK